MDDAASASRGAGTSKAGRIGRDGTDETYIGGVEPDLPGGRAQGKKVLTGVAVEVREPKGMGRCRMAPLADVSAASLDQFVTDHVEPGATVVADGWRGYRGLDKLGYSHVRHSQRAARFRGEDPGKLLPTVRLALVDCPGNTYRNARHLVYD